MEASDWAWAAGLNARRTTRPTSIDLIARMPCDRLPDRKSGRGGTRGRGSLVVTSRRAVDWKLPEPMASAHHNIRGLPGPSWSVPTTVQRAGTQVGLRGQVRKD